ncbi:hypothetical protein MKQ68_24530 [Chitinophaga horti]|uniref:Lipocalin-like domain-containing protein n=1 Tax=Chitinophaga horti TaxID=2920382 RepID=A0ABY6J4N0_9BACT|nr:hypothetical protein [Chitinophaga horti]UYQ93254.1 hypothetical protein MKQ68_24530 [Chitinophaga horti]
MRYLLLLPCCLLATACSKTKDAGPKPLTGTWEAVAYRGMQTSFMWRDLSGPRMTYQLKSNGRWVSSGTPLNITSGMWEAQENWGGGFSLTLKTADTSRFFIARAGANDTMIWSIETDVMPGPEGWKMVKR